VHLGVPYTRYAFNSDLRGDELFLGDVPLMVPLSYTFMAYFAFSSGRLLASGPWRTRASRRWHEWVLALILARLRRHRRRPPRDALLHGARAEPPRPVDGVLHHPRLPVLITYNAQVAHLAIVALVIGGILAETIGGSFFLMWIPVGAIDAVPWSNFARRARAKGPLRRTGSGSGTELAGRQPLGRLPAELVAVCDRRPG
jgi:hypothetical protein